MKKAGSNREVPQNPVILRCHRIMEAFAKSDDERDFYLDRVEGFLVFVDLDKSEPELADLESELQRNPDQYVPVPKLTFYEVKKLMEGFVNEKVYDVDTKEKLLDIIQAKEARENFLEFVYDHHSEMEKWQQYYQERFRVRIIEWLRNHNFDFVFEEDVELTKSIVERIKMNMFTSKASKDIVQARKILAAKAATYYSNEALNPRPKRGRPPKQVVKVETEPQFSQDIYTSVPKSVKPFLFSPDYHSASMVFTFSGKFTSAADLLAFRRQQVQSTAEFTSIGHKLAAIRTLSSTHSSPLDFEADEGASAPIRSGSKKVPAAAGGQPLFSADNEVDRAARKPNRGLGKDAVGKEKAVLRKEKKSVSAKEKSGSEKVEKSSSRTGGSVRSRAKPAASLAEAVKKPVKKKAVSAKAEKAEKAKAPTKKTTKQKVRLRPLARKNRT